MNTFNVWNEIKQQIDSEEDSLENFPQKGEVWMCTFGKNIGFEQNGSGNNFSRPGLVIKKFTNKMFWVIPLSSKQKQIDFYFNYTDPQNQQVSAILAQLKLVSIKRLRRKMYD